MQVINDQLYYPYEDIAANAPVFCKSARGAREIIKKHKVPEKMYLFARMKKGKMIVTNGKSYKHDKVFFHEDYVNENIPEMRGEKVDKVEEAPPLIHLDDDQKFSYDGRVLEIETRGEVEYDKIFFKAKDVEKEFWFGDRAITNLFYSRHKEDCKYFKCVYGSTSKKELFLTYHGFIRVLFTSKTGIAHRFTQFILQPMLTHQFGHRVFSDTCNIEPECDTTGYIYLFSLGTIGSLRDSMDIPFPYSDEAVVCKYGKTCDIKRREEEHAARYGLIKNVDLKLEKCITVDPMDLSFSEYTIKQYMVSNGYVFDHKFTKELVVLPRSTIQIFDTLL